MYRIFASTEYPHPHPQNLKEKKGGYGCLNIFYKARKKLNKNTKNLKETFEKTGE